jgi:hypothetical protein
MSNPPPAKSAPLVTILTVMAGFALFLLVLYYLYLPHQTGPFTGDGIRTAEQRQANLAELRAKQAKQAASYAWIDRKAGVVQLPLDVAMDLTVQKYAVRK